MLCCPCGFLFYQVYIFDAIIYARTPGSNYHLLQP